MAEFKQHLLKIKPLTSAKEYESYGAKHCQHEDQTILIYQELSASQQGKVLLFYK